MLDVLLESLSKRESSENVCNQYRDKNILNNFKVFFEYLIEVPHDALFVGEAPGHKGCRWTGIPFTCGTVVRSRNHTFFAQLAGKIELPKVLSGNTASTLWDFFGKDRPVPILWNAFPFHPHKQGVPDSNRTPTHEELAEGQEYLKMVYDIFKHSQLCGIGRMAEKALKTIARRENILCQASFAWWQKTIS